MPKLFAVTIALFLLLGAGYGAIQAARATPWDCSDWQAFAHDDRTTAILESLAENRGKTLYCGIDQSDTFTKAETWQAGKDRNERDDTVYWGERGSFRGFIAAQEGWLTEGESGITGQSIATIFEFPKEEQQGRRKKVKRIDIGTDPAQFPINAAASCGQLLGLICATPERYVGSEEPVGGDAHVRRRGRAAAVGAGLGLQFGPNVTHYHVDWQTNDRWAVDAQSGQRTATLLGDAWPGTELWMQWAAAAADRACRDQGYQYITGSAAIGPSHSENRGSGAPDDRGEGLGFFFRQVWNSGNTAYSYQTRQSRTWTARCKKVIRGSRR